jgi:predicted DNA-binding transcriptional regulator AlpA
MPRCVNGGQKESVVLTSRSADNSAQETVSRNRSVMSRAKMLMMPDDARFSVGANMRVLGYADLKEKGIRFSRQWVSKLIARGEFPAPIRLGQQTVAFIEAEIDEWLACRIRERDEKPTSNRRLTGTARGTTLVLDSKAKGAEAR